MSTLGLLFTVTALALIGWFVARARAAQFACSRRRPGASPAHHGWRVAAFTLLPPLLFLSVWATVSPALVTDRVLATPAAAALPPPGYDRATILAEARGLAAGERPGAFHPLSRTLAPAYAAAQLRTDWIAAATALLLGLIGGALAFGGVRADFAAHASVERLVRSTFLAASLLAILTTLGIALSLAWQGGRFFAIVSPADFLFGTHWSLQAIDSRDPGASLGALPVFWGTVLIAVVIAMAVAIPVGLGAAIWLTQYARPATRRRVKPALELLAGVPTVVYGWFAALSVAPAVRSLGVALGIESASGESALAAGLVMGAMIVPFVSSVADDSLHAVPVALRDGSLALGATPSETIRQVLLPAALPGVVGGVLLGVSRAVGETVIVVMAASGVATLSANPFAPATAVTRQIVDLLTGEAVFDSPKTLAAFALGLVLFAITLALNVAALGIVRRHGQAHG